MACWLSAFALLQSACGPKDEVEDPDAITVGALLPFTGKEAAIGRNLEQALLLAVHDVNAAGGVGGRKLRLISRDSNSGSARGLDELLQLLYTDKVQYLIGPEENELANAIVPDVKGLDILNILPGYAAPPIEHISAKGAWVRLAPAPAALACGMAQHAIRNGVGSANIIVSQDDFNGTLATDFSGQFDRLGGDMLPSVTVTSGASSYSRKITQAFGYGAEQTVLIAYPQTAATIATEWTIKNRTGSWYLSPMLHAEVFLLNTPYGALDGFQGLSPSLSLLEECEPGATESEVSCTRDNAENFSRHFADYWNGDTALPASYFYYDAMVLLAMGLQQGLAKAGQLPLSKRARDEIRSFGNASAQAAHWWSLTKTMAGLADRKSAHYVGAGSAYTFDTYGAAQHVIFDTWTIQNGRFVDTGALKADCPRSF